jgi:hypothetical protein
LKEIVKHLDFSGAPIFSIFNGAREKVTQSFIDVMRQIDGEFKCQF